MISSENIEYIREPKSAKTKRIKLIKKKRELKRKRNS